MRQHRVENGAEALLQLYVKVDDRQRAPADMACRLVERDDATLMYCACCSSNRGDGIGLVMQNVTPDHGIECWTLGKSVVQSDDKFNPSKSSRERSRFGDVDRDRFA